MSDKVVSIFKPTKPKKKTEKNDGEFSFEEIIRKNAKNDEKLKKERNRANKGVVRSHRLER